MTIDTWRPSDLDRAAAPHDLPPEPSQVRLPAASDGLILWLEPGRDGAVLHLEGALDLAGGAHLGTTIEQIQATDPGHLTVDATALRFIDLSGLRALMACRRSRAGTSDRPDLLAGAAVERLRHLVDIAGSGASTDNRRLPVEFSRSVLRADRS